MKTLPPPSEMYRALVDRDTSFDGSFFAAIRTTGIFCRPGCGARKPKLQNVEFFGSAADAERAGYRACLRCRPLESAPVWTHRMNELADSGTHLSARDLRANGIDPVRASRYCRARFGMSFGAWARSRRLAGAFERIRSGASVSEVAHASGFESESGFRDAFVRLFGAPPTRALEAGRGVLRVAWIRSPLGPLLAAASDDGVCLLEFADRRALRSQIATLRRRFPVPVVPGSNEHLDELAAELEEYFSGRRRAFDVPVVLRGTPFQESVWERLRAIPAGETRSYADVAREIGRPSAVRAVARANGENRIAILVPCHRVIGSDGSPTGYGGGVWRKESLLAHEREHAGTASAHEREAGSRARRSSRGGSR